MYGATGEGRDKILIFVCHFNCPILFLNSNSPWFWMWLCHDKEADDNILQRFATSTTNQPSHQLLCCCEKTSWNVEPTPLGGRLLLVAIRWQSGGWTLGTIPTVRTAGLMLLPLLLLSAFPCFATSLFAVLPESELLSITRCRFVEGIKRVAFGSDASFCLERVWKCFSRTFGVGRKTVPQRVVVDWTDGDEGWIGI